MKEFTARFATSAEIDGWDGHVTANPQGGNVLQSKSFAAIKDYTGWKPRFVVLETPDYSSYNLVLEKTFPMLGRFWYMIKGPDAAAAEDLAGMLRALKTFIAASRMRVFALKIEPDIPADAHQHALFTRLGLVRAPVVQTNTNTAILDIGEEPQELLRKLGSRGRHAVRKAIRSNVEVVKAPANEDTYRIMYNLMGKVGQGKANVVLRPFEYYAKFWQLFSDAGQGRMYFVYEDGKPSVGAFVLNYGRKGTYKDGGSLPARSQYGDSHLVQWTAINELKGLGVTEYDFCGTPPSDQLKDEAHPAYGRGLFKTSFTKNVIDWCGPYDLPLSPWRYKVWTKLVERAMRKLSWRRTRQPYY